MFADLITKVQTGAIPRVILGHNQVLNGSVLSRIGGVCIPGNAAHQVTLNNRV